MAVSFDNGTAYGQPAGENGVYEPVVDLPKFDPLSIEVEWRLLPASLMQQILVLPHRLERLRRKLSELADTDSPPDYEHYFSARQYDFAVLAIQVMDALRSLRAHVKLTEEPIQPGEWDRRAGITAHKSEMDEQRAARDRAHEQMMRGLNIP